MTSSIFELLRQLIFPHQHPVPHTSSTLLYIFSIMTAHCCEMPFCQYGLSSITRLYLHHLQSSEHFQAGHAPPAHPVPRGLVVHEEAVRAVFGPEWTQLSSDQQGPLQSGLSALRGQVQFGWRVNSWIWTPAGLQQHVGFPLQFS